VVDAAQFKVGVGLGEVLAIFSLLTVIPPFLVEHWWKGRERRQEERLMVLPD
jgi:hypothetical protein